MEFKPIIKLLRADRAELPSSTGCASLITARPTARKRSQIC